MKCHVCCMKTSETSQAFLSEEFRGVEEETEVNAYVPVACRIGKVVAVEGETGEWEIIDRRQLSYEFRLAEPAVVTRMSRTVGNEIAYRRIHIEITSELQLA